MTLSFNLLESDAPRFESLTADNIDTRFLMMIGDRPVFSGMIYEPISGGRIRFGSTNQAMIDAVKKELTNMPRGKRAEGPVPLK
jgi:hypothetical protein